MNSSQPDTPESARTAPPALWRVAAAFLGVLNLLFGAPENVAAQHTLTAKAHGVMASWLRSAEAMLRRLLLIEAAAYPKPNTRPLLRVSHKRARKLMQFWPEKPEEWRVSFRCLAADRRLPAGKALQSATAASESNASCRLEAGGPQSQPVFVFREDRRPPTRALRVSKDALRHAQGSKHRRRLLRQERLWLQHEPKLHFRSAWPLAERYEALLRVFNDPAPYARRLSRRLHATPHRLREALRAPPEAEHRIECFEILGEEARSRWRPHFSSA